MPAFFPELLPDELLFSAVARFGDMRGAESDLSTVQEVFGPGVRTLSLDLPVAIEAFLSRLPPGHPYTAGEIIQKHTSYPYYRGFIGPERAEVVERALLKGGTDPYVRLGLARMSIRPPDRLRFCPACAEEDRAANGQPYWRRVHQLPGMFVCPAHSGPLWVSAIDRWGRLPGRTLRSLASISRGEVAEPALPAVEPEILRWLARETQALLDADHAPRTREALLAQLRSFLGAGGWAGSGSRPRVRVQPLRDAFIEFLNRDKLAALGAALVPVRRGEDWLQWLVQHPGLRHPLQYLLLLRFLGVSTETFFTGAAPPSVAVSRPTLTGPCGNPLCEHYDPPVPREVPRSLSRGSSHVTVRCPACGYTYGQRARDPRHRKILEMGELYERRLREMVQDPTITLTTIHQTLGTTPATAQRQAKRLGLWRPEWKTFDRNGRTPAYAERLRKAREGRRRKWLRLRARYPEEGRNELRARDTTLYTWLRKNDRVWIEAHQPEVKPSEKPPMPIDWEARDADALARVVATMPTLWSHNGRPRRITETGIGRGIGSGGETFRRHLAHMPRTRAFVELVVESLEDVARRRFAWAALEFAERGRAATLSDLVRRAHLGGADHVALRATAVPAAVEALRSHIFEGAPLPGEWTRSLSPPPAEPVPAA